MARPKAPDRDALLASLPEIVRVREAAELLETDHLAALLADPEVQAKLAVASSHRNPGQKLMAYGWLGERGLFANDPEPDPAPSPILGRNGKPLSQGNPRKEPFVPYAVSRRMSDIQPQEVHWLWRGRFPLRRLSGIQAKQGRGKSTLLCWFASMVSSGQPWPDSLESNPAGSVVILQAEEIDEEDYPPRFVAMGADQSKIHVIPAIVRNASGVEHHPNLRDDVEAVRRKIQEIGDVRLLMVDPMASYTAGISGYNTTEVREFMEPLKRMTEETRIATLLFMHPSKDSDRDILDRAGGASAFSELLRMYWLYSTDPKNRNRRVLSVLKPNTRGAIKTGLSVGVRGDSLAWSTRPVKMDGNDVDNALQKIAREERLTGVRGRPPVSTNRACEFILASSDMWPVLQGCVEDMALQAGIGRTCFIRAIDRLKTQEKVVREKVGKVWWIKAPEVKADEAPTPDSGASGPENPPNV